MKLICQGRRETFNQGSPSSVSLYKGGGGLEQLFVCVLWCCFFVFCVIVFCVFFVRRKFFFYDVVLWFGCVCVLFVFFVICLFFFFGGVFWETFVNVHGLACV